VSDRIERIARRIMSEPDPKPDETPERVAPTRPVKAADVLTPDELADVNELAASLREQTFGRSSRGGSPRTSSDPAGAAERHHKLYRQAQDRSGQ
jgi:hypothetical protein